jgi:glycosyltransferase involved in cell wall biosynthesis
MKTKTKFSFVIPCLNEELTLPFVLKKINQIKDNYTNDYDIEVIVSDNGSQDNSPKIALEHGAKVIPSKVKGYGAALDNGIRHASGEYIIFADADDTYDWLEAPLLMQKILETQSDMVVGSRLNGNIHQNAMPFLHRYLGTPVINWIINFLYAQEGKVLDANSGFRCFKKKAISVGIFKVKVWSLLPKC